MEEEPIVEDEPLVSCQVHDDRHEHQGRHPERDRRRSVGPLSGPQLGRHAGAAPALDRLSSRARTVWSRATLRIRTLGRDLDALVLGDVLERLLQREHAWAGSASRDLGRRRADVGELLLLGGVDVHVVGAGVLADDHALVDVDAGTDEQLAPLLEAVRA